jgi:transcriptional regulator with XRE-family HTH domain
MAALEARVARNVAAERVRKGWDQTELAARLATLAGVSVGWSRSTVSSLEGGGRRINVNDLPLLCGVLEISLEKLFENADQADLDRLRL